MRLVSFKHNGRISLGAVSGDHIVDLTAVAPTMEALIEMGREGLSQVNDHLAHASPAFLLSEVQLTAPITTPRRNVMCLGLNYAEHVRESYSAQGKTTTLPQFPIVFNKATTAVIGTDAEIPHDANVSDKLDWEAELAFIIGKKGKNIPEAQALNFVFGYTILNDISARDLQRQGKQYFKGKSLDGSCPIGPWIVTPDELPDPHNLAIQCRVNGITKQDSFTKYMIFQIPAIIAYLSKGMTLLPGDIIATGTPDGVGFARKPPEYLHPGDVVECEIERIGVLRNVVTAVKPGG